MIGKTRIFLSSYSHKWSMGFKHFTPDEPRSLYWFIDRAAENDLDGIQIADNLFPEKINDGDCLALKSYADAKGIILQWGFDGWNRAKVERLIEICRISGSKLLRGIFGKTFTGQYQDPGDLKDAILKEFADILPELQNNRITLVIENHFDMPPEILAEVIREFDNPLVRICLDTTNALGYLITPLQTVEMLGPYTTTMHLKDFTIKKVVGGYEIMGVAVGAGDQDSYTIIKTALEINPEMEICIELGTPPPEMDPPYFDYEIEQVNKSVKKTMELVRQYQRDKG